MGDCEFCGEHGVDVWDVKVWFDHFARVFDMYEQLLDGASGPPLHVRLQQDWKIFSFNDSDRILAFLKEVTIDRPVELLESQVAVRPQYEERGAGADHASRWDEFRQQLIHTNRYFPVAELDLDYLRDLVLNRQQGMSKGMKLFRGRVGGASPYPIDEMGTAPRHLVTGGRANPVGIPHLYLAGDVQTCLKESRASFNGFVSVATFEISRDVKYLDLARLGHENPFLISDSDEEGNALVRSLVASQFLSELGHELSIPTRPGENQLEYVPTQYLCEFVKSLGIAGIRYNSSLNPEGWNIVLFDETDATPIDPIDLYEVTGFSLDFEKRN